MVLLHQDDHMVNRYPIVERWVERAGDRWCPGGRRRWRCGPLRAMAFAFRQRRASFLVYFADIYGFEKLITEIKFFTRGANRSRLFCCRMVEL